MKIVPNSRCPNCLIQLALKSRNPSLYNDATVNYQHYIASTPLLATFSELWSSPSQHICSRSARVRECLVEPTLKQGVRSNDAQDASRDTRRVARCQQPERTRRSSHRAGSCSDRVLPHTATGNHALRDIDWCRMILVKCRYSYDIILGNNRHLQGKNRKMPVH